MGLKEEMEGDVTGGAGSGPKVSVRKKAPVEQDVLITHKHGDGRCEVAHIDEDGRRRVTPMQGRIPRYVFNCKACVADDQKRMALAAPELDLDSTVFLIPEMAPDSLVALAYLEKRYPGQELATMDTIRPTRLALRKGVTIVVVTRRALPGSKHVGSLKRLIEDKRGEMIEVDVSPAEYIAEIVESAPLNVDDCVAATAATMFQDAQVDLTELCLSLCDVAAPRYRIDQYQRVVGSEETVFTMRRCG
jgi:hypothetical protein